MLLLWVPRLFKNWNPKKKKIKIKIGILGTSLVFRGLRISLPMQGTRVQSLVGEVRPHRLWGNSGAGRARPSPRGAVLYLSRTTSDRTPAC